MNPPNLHAVIVLGLASAIFAQGCGEHADDIPMPEGTLPESLVATSDTGWSTITTAMTGRRCLDVSGASREAGAMLQIWDCNGGENQKFRFDSSNGALTTYHGDFCVEASSPAGDGDPVLLARCTGSANQRWTYDRTTQEILGLNGACLDVAGVNPNRGAKLQLFHCWGGLNQRWDHTRSPVADPGTEGDGDIEVGPDYTTHPDAIAKATSPHGKVYLAHLGSQGTLFDGLDRTLALANQHSFDRDVRVYVPKQYVNGTAAPFMVVEDGVYLATDVQNTLDNLIAAKKIPVMIAIMADSGGGDGPDSERGLEYDTMSNRYSRFVDEDVLPFLQKDPGIKADYSNLRFTDDPEGRASYGCSSGGAAAMAQGWFTPDRYRRLVTYSGTLVDQQDRSGITAPENALYPLGASEYHEDLNLVASSSKKPLRIFLNANERDLNFDGTSTVGHHNWLIANKQMAAALHAKGYHYRFVYGKGASHCDARVRRATLPDTLTWMWRGYPID